MNNNPQNNKSFWHRVPSFLKGKEIVHTLAVGVSLAPTLLILAELHHRLAPPFPRAVRAE